MEEGNKEKGQKFAAKAEDKSYRRGSRGSVVSGCVRAPAVRAAEGEKLTRA